MSAPAALLLMLLIAGTGAAADVPFVFKDSTFEVAGYSADQLESMRVSSSDLAGVPPVTTPSDEEVLQFPVAGGGSSPEGTAEKNAGDLKRALDARVEPDNSRVRDEAVVLALKYPGEKTIEQIASIYSYLKNGDSSKKGWGYVSDPRGIDYFMFANQTLKNGDRANCAGGGDCDDFAILMSALVESVGGTTRIILARSSSIGGHAYTEVYLGNLSAQNNQVEGIINWLKEKFGTDRIYTHIDTDTKDVWLNLDWGADDKGNAHPGGPFFQGDKHIVLCIRDAFQRTPLRLPEGFIWNSLPEPEKYGLIAVLGNLSNPKNSVAFSPDGRVLAAGCQNGTIILWDAASGREMRALKGHSEWVSSLAFSPDGGTIASTSGDNTIKLWNVNDGREIRTLQGHSDWVENVAFSPDGRTIASGSYDGTIRIWNAADGSEIRSLNSEHVLSVSFSPNGRTIASGSIDSSIKLWDVDSGSEIRTLNGHSGPVMDVAFSPDGRTIASGSYDHTIKLWRTDNGSEIHTLYGHSGEVQCIAFSPDGRTIASGSWDSTIKLWDVAHGSEVRTLQGCSDRAESVAFRPDGYILVSACYDGTIRLWRVA
ncbi:MAG: transglutaminase domain-containing protein [Methanothrix sp.]|nr:transglutaminase domain-containing protein [Methanothrix sp.]